jgi:hypothetical protein
MKAWERGEREQRPLSGLGQGTHRTAMVIRKEIEILLFLALLSPNLSLDTAGNPLIAYGEYETASIQCSTPYAETLSEALLKAANGGAGAVWTSSGLTEPNGQAIRDEELIRLLLNGEKLTLGEATARAKAAVSDEDIRRTWIPFGDPTTKLKS